MVMEKVLRFSCKRVGFVGISFSWEKRDTENNIDIVHSEKNCQINLMYFKEINQLRIQEQIQQTMPRTSVGARQQMHTVSFKCRLEVLPLMKQAMSIRECS